MENHRTWGEGGNHVVGGSLREERNNGGGRNHRRGRKSTGKGKVNGRGKSQERGNHRERRFRCCALSYVLARELNTRTSCWNVSRMATIILGTAQAVAFAYTDHTHKSNKHQRNRITTTGKNQGSKFFCFFLFFFARYSKQTT